MAALPTGTITFLFSDVEGSTRLWDDYPQVMRTVMARHDALLTQMFEEHDGVVVRPRGEGDSLFAVFIRASDAVAAALAGQRALLAEDWGVVGPLRVRMGLHTGEADLREGDYYGSAVNRCARIRAAGHGGQVLLSEATAKLVRGSLPLGAALVDLGRQRLKDLAEPEQVYQLTAPGLPEAFPPLATLDARPNNLPLLLTSFLGREQELADLAQLLANQRLVTLTGPGGSGKTRLAQQVAAETMDAFTDGVFFIDLAPLGDPTLVPFAVAQALGVQGLPDIPIRETVLRFLREKRLLLLLDNYEHLLEAAAFVGALLQAAPAVTLLVTSRAPLRVPGEREYAVPSLPLPRDAAAPVIALARNPAVALFAARAQAVRSDFTLTPDNAAAVAAICTRLDGLPLAIELAAARVRVLPPPALLSRLEQRLPLLTGGGRTMPARQQTLRDTIAWSYDLLQPAQQRLFWRLGVFVGGCTLELAEVVCTAAGDLALDVFDGISTLVEQSLLRQETGVAAPTGEPRFRMLETIREYARERLAAAGEGDLLARGHAEACVAFAERAAPYLAGAEQAVWLRRMAAEYDNLRAALAWCAQHHAPELEARLAVALPKFWKATGHLSEGALVLHRVVVSAATVPLALRARVFLVAGAFAETRRELMQALAHLEESLQLYRELADPHGIAASLEALGDVAEAQGDLPRAVALLEESLALRRQLGDVPGIASALQHLGSAALASGEVDWAGSLLDEALTIRQQLGDSVGVADVLTTLGVIAQLRRQPDQAAALFHRARERYQEVAHQGGRATVLLFEGLLYSTRGDQRQAAEHLLASLTASRDTENTPLILTCLTALATVSAAAGRAAPAARLLGAAECAGEVIGFTVPRYFRRNYTQSVRTIREALGEVGFASAWAAGRGLSWDEAVAEALATARAGARDCSQEVS